MSLVSFRGPNCTRQSPDLEMDWLVNWNLLQWYRFTSAFAASLLGTRLKSGNGWWLVVRDGDISIQILFEAFEEQIAADK